jgi:hypothetical protein
MMKKYPHVMLDLETLALTRDALVVSIGAAVFDPSAEDGETVGPSFHAVLDRDSQRTFRATDAGTVSWWSRQSTEARAVFDEPKEPVPAALQALDQFIHDFCSREYEVWGNGPTFDNEILASLYHDVGFSPPWRTSPDGGYRGKADKCFRTLKGLFPSQYSVLQQRRRRDLTEHHAEKDALWQADTAVRLIRRLRALNALSEAAEALTDGDGSLVFGPIMAGPERDELQRALDSVRETMR